MSQQTSPDGPYLVARRLIMSTAQTKSQSQQKQDLAYLASILDKPIPLLEVVVIISARYLYAPNEITGQEWALLAKKLVAAEVAPGGPYRASPTEAASLELNAAIAFLFRHIGKPLRKVEHFVTAALSHTAIPVTPPIPDNTPVASTFLQYLIRFLSDNPLVVMSNQTSSCPVWQASIYKKIKADCQRQPEAIRTILNATLGSVQRTDRNGEISQIAAMCYRSLLGDQGPVPTLPLLQEANVYTWMAYTLYDQLLDGQVHREPLPAANICMRKAYQLYCQASPDAASRDLIDAAFDHADQANAWELAHARAIASARTITLPPLLPDFADWMQLARRSEPHILGPLLVALQSGISEGQLRNFQQGWQQYLIAKQLNDDLHDWQEDLQAGHLTVVVCQLLRVSGLSLPGGTCQKHLLLAALRNHFWDSEMEQLSKVVLAHTRSALAAFKQSNVLRTNSELYTLCARIEQAAHDALRQRQGYRDFAESFRTPKTYA